MTAQAAYIYDRLLAGREGSLELDGDAVDSMDLADSNAITAKIDYETRIRPNLRVNITDTPDGGLRFAWKERS